MKLFRDTNETLQIYLNSFQELIKSTLIDGCKLLPLADISSKVSEESVADLLAPIHSRLVRGSDGDI